MKTYKLWIEIEEYDDQTDEYRAVTEDGEAEPVPLGGFFSSLCRAVEAAESLEGYFGVTEPTWHENAQALAETLVRMKTQRETLQR